MTNSIVVLSWEIATAAPAFSKSHPDQPAASNMESKILHQQKDDSLLKAQMMISAF